MIRYIIDGHNIIHQVKKYLTLLDRNHILCQKIFYQDLVNYAETRQVNIILIFDGNPAWDPPKGEKKVLIKFSGSNRDADSVIISLAEKWKGRQTAVVTDDRSIIREVIDKGCTILTPSDFGQLIQRKITKKSYQPSEYPEKPGELSPSQVEWWKKEMKRALAKKSEKEK